MRENELVQRYSKDIATFWQQGYFSHFVGVKNIRINYAIFTDSRHRHSIVIVPGRCEGYLKYQELIHDFFQQGYNVFILDHRGQGISQRLLTNPYKGYVESFDDYRDDLYHFIDKIVTDTNVKNNNLSKPYLLAHSMGSAISIRLLQQYPQCIQAAVLASPMIAINTGTTPLWLAKMLIKTGDFFNRYLSNEPWYFLGQKNYAKKSFADNLLMQSKIRYQIFSTLYQDTAEIQLGGATIHWLNEAIKINRAIFADIHHLSTPLIVLQAGQDKIVDNHAQDKFCQQLNDHYPYSCDQGTPIAISGAKHELFFEQDQYRDIAIKNTLQWFSQYTDR